MAITVQGTFNTLNRMANKVSGDAQKKSIALQFFLGVLVVLRVFYAVWAFLHLSLSSLMWSLVVLSVLFLGICAARMQSRFFLLLYIAAACVLMVLTSIGIFLALLGDVLTLSVDVLSIILDGVTLLIQLITVALAYNLYLYLDPKHNRVEELNGATDQAQFPMDDKMVNIDLEEEAAIADRNYELANQKNEFQQPSPYAWAVQTDQMPVYQDAVYSPYVYASAPTLSQAETAPNDDPNPFHEPK